MIENKLEIQAIFKYPGFFRRSILFVAKLLRLKSDDFMPIEGRPFFYGIRVKNIGESVFEGALATNVRIRPVTQSMNYVQITDKEFIINTLNPQDTSTIWMNKIQVRINGPVWLNFQLTPKNTGATITTYQVGLDGTNLKYIAPNAWAECFVIRSIFEVAQQRTNNLILFLTALLAIQGVWGLNEFAIVILHGLINFLQLVASALNWLSKTI